MTARPSSLVRAREVMKAALDALNSKGQYTPCAGKPAKYADMRGVTVKEAKAMCAGCPLIIQCRNLGFTESVYADEMVYGGKVFRRGKPVTRDKN